MGMATVMEGYPREADAVNEKGRAMAGLNFPGNAFYPEPEEGTDSVASFELIPWILGRCASVKEAAALLKNARIVNLSFAEKVPPAPLHWMLADKEQCLVIESVKEGLKIYENPYGVLTNNPPFPFHQMNLHNYLNLSAGAPKNRFAKGGELEA